MRASITTTSIVKGQTATINLIENAIVTFQQVQVEIYDAGTPNPKSKLGFGTTAIENVDGSHDVRFDTTNLSTGIYEIKLIRLHTPINIDHKPEIIDYISNRDFQRIFFEVVNINDSEKTQDFLKDIVLKFEQTHDRNFHSGIVIPGSGIKIPFSVFVLVKGLKLGHSYKLDRLEVVPLTQGLDTLDELNITNWFLKTYTQVGIEFPYDDNIRLQSQGKFPAVVVHFPLITSNNEEQVRDFAVQKTSFLLHAFSLTRGANGQIFDIVSVNLEANVASRYSVSTPYVGNLLTGSVAGEDPDTLISYVESLEKSSFKNFLVQLHKEAIQEVSVDFKFLRYWNILELLAVSKNYNEQDDLLDFEGNAIHDKNNQIRKIKGSLNTVFHLLKTHKIGSSIRTFENVGMWLSLRNAVAHFGSTSEWAKLRSSTDREYAEKAVKIISDSRGTNPILFDLKEDVKLILMRELIEG